MKRPDRPVNVVAFALATLLVCGVLLGLAGCLEQQARQRALDPALAGTVGNVVDDARAVPGADAETCDLFLAAVKEKRYTDALAVWPSVQAWAADGINRTTFSEGIKVELRERLKQFDLTLRKAAIH